MQIPENYKLFYNPVWMPTEDDIELFACFIPEKAIVNDVDIFLSYLKDRYKAIIINAFDKHGKKIFDWYHEFVDENYWYRDEQDLAHCFFDSDLVSSEIWALKSRVKENVIPDYIIGTDDIELSNDWYHLLQLLHSRRT